MAKKSTVVYTLDLLVHIELANDVSFRNMQSAVKVIKEIISTHLGEYAIVESVTVDKTIIQKKVTY